VKGGADGVSRKKEKGERGLAEGKIKGHEPSKGGAGGFPHPGGKKKALEI